jgi:hydroxymethylglutaryl-CoA lyase
MTKIKIVECPRDAMQGIAQFIPTQTKIDYINSLLKVGFDTIDFGSFVSPRAVPQMKDTAEVLDKLDLTNTSSKLLAIIGNTVGGEIASQYDKITYLGFPFSISPTFLKNNINSTIARSLVTTNRLLNLCEKKDKTLVVYISMAFGNPYGDFWNTEIVEEWVDILSKLGVKIIALSDTVGISSPEIIHNLFATLIPKYPNVEFGFHLHTSPNAWQERIASAFKAGCRRFDTVLNGIGGCPMSGMEMIGNLKTSYLFSYLEDNNHTLEGIDKAAFADAYMKASNVFTDFDFKKID